MLEFHHIPRRPVSDKPDDPEKWEQHRAGACCEEGRCVRHGNEAQEFLSEEGE